ncbi:hypothetical protein L1987_85487 [Smallanthus sonchifolius]|uniref:Uncharacterized protein n=1 Tax=Smallanthus sonchifolius TaxID=185202 RepID=A0ACB8XXR5_9ASTR|nr:hypothetical protein L1987_85487 [Smallanthus sonchifolius]
MFTSKFLQLQLMFVQLDVHLGISVNVTMFQGGPSNREEPPEHVADQRAEDSRPPLSSYLFPEPVKIDQLGTYAGIHPTMFILGYCSTYIFMQTFMIPGTIFMSLLAGALFGVIKGIFLVVFNSTAGASYCYIL